MLSFTAFGAPAAEVKVDSMQLYRAVFDTPELLLRGAVPGVSVGATDGNLSSAKDVMIRGLNSVYGHSSPLWIVDGAELHIAPGEQIDAFWRDEYAPYSFMTQLSALDFINLSDIESIEVLDNVSATAVYGSRGANGVIAIKTKHPHREMLDLNVNSNVGVSIPGGGIAGARAGISHVHNVRAQFSANNADYFLSAFYKDYRGSVPSDMKRFGGLRLKYDTHTNKFIWFGINVNLAVGRQSVATTSALYGVPTLGTTLRNISIPESISSVDGWNSDYDDYSRVFRANGDAYVQVNFLPSLKWRTSLGFDSSNSSRYVWYGLGTDFGKGFNRTAALVPSTLFGFNVRTELSFDRYFATHHRVSAGVSAEYRGNESNYNNMDGHDFLTDALREKGFGLRQSAIPPYRVEHRTYTYGGSAVIGYSFRNIVGVKGSVTADRNTRYDDSFNIYPAGEAYLDLRNAFFGNSEAVSGLRIEGGYGKSGRLSYSPFRNASKMVDADFLAGRLSEAGIVIDENVPEKNIASLFDACSRILSSEYNISLSASFISGRIRFKAVWYDRKTTDSFHLYSFGMPGESYLWKASGKQERIYDETLLSNRGISAGVDAVAVAGKDFTLAFNAGAARNFFSIDKAGAGMAAGLPGRALADAVPDFTGYFGASASVGRFSFDLSFDGACGFSIVDLNSALSKSAEIDKLPGEYVSDGSFLRLSRAAASYRLPFSGKNFIKALKFTLSGSNIFTISGYSGLNPDVNSYVSASECARGIDYGSLPQLSSVMFGVTAEF